MTAAILGNNRVNRPHGHGGQAATWRASEELGRRRADGRREDYGHICEVAMNIDDVFVIQTPGGGGSVHRRSDRETPSGATAAPDGSAYSVERKSSSCCRCVTGRRW